MKPRERIAILKKKLKEEGCSQEELEELYYLIENDGGQDEMDVFMEQLWQELPAGQPLPQTKADNMLEAISQGTTIAYLKRQKNTQWWQYMRVAASVILLAGLVAICSYYYTHQPEKEVEYLTRSTKYGQRATIVLNDGSRVMLNAGSSITYPERFTDNIREVTLTGEAFFEVTPNPRKPFQVHSNSLVTRVLGTSFNIKAFDKDPVEVTVATGRVEVTIPASADSLAKNHSPSPESVVLTPNQQVTYHQQEHSLELAEVDLTPYLAWRNHALYFEMETFSSVIQTLERWYNVKITLTNTSASECRITADYQRESLENVLKGLRLLVSFDYHFTEAGKITIEPKGCIN